jgi:hypothetical protein
MIRVVMPLHLRTPAHVDGELTLEVALAAGAVFRVRGRRHPRCAGQTAAGGDCIRKGAVSYNRSDCGEGGVCRVIHGDCSVQHDQSRSR